MRLRNLGKVAASITVAGGLALAATACSSDDDSSLNDNDGGGGNISQGGARDRVLASVSSFEATSYSMDFAMTVDGQPGMLDATMDVDPEAGAMSMDMVMDLGTLMEAMPEEFDQQDMDDMDAYGMDPEAMLSEMNISMIAIGDTAWMQMSGGIFDMLSGAYGPDTWFEIPAEEANMEDLGAMNLETVTEDMLAQMGDDITETSPGTFEGTLDPAAAESADMANLAGELSGDITFTVTLDDQDRLSTMDITFPGALEGKDMGMTIDVTDYGKDVTISEPTGNIVDGSELGMF